MVTWNLDIQVTNVDKIQNLDYWLTKLLEDQRSLNGAQAEAANAVERSAKGYLSYGNIMREVLNVSDKEIENLAKSRIYHEDMNSAMQTRLNLAYELARAEKDMAATGTQVVDVNEQAALGEEVMASVRDDNLRSIEDQMTAMEDFSEAQKLRHEGTFEEVADLYLLDEQIAEDTRVQKENEAALRARTKELTNQSISLFVASIVFTQWATLGKQMAGDNKELAKTFDQMKYSIQFVILPFQTYTAVAYMAEQQSMKTSRAALSLGMAFAAAFMVLYAFQQKSPAIRAAIMALAGVIATLAVVNWLAASAATAKWVASAGPAAPIMAAVIVGSIMAAIGAITAMQGGQTMPDTMREIIDTGPIIAHRGEVLSRGTVSSQTTNNMGQSNQITINVNGNADQSTVDQLRRALTDVLASGQYQAPSNARSSI